MEIEPPIVKVIGAIHASYDGWLRRGYSHHSCMSISAVALGWVFPCHPPDQFIVDGIYVR